MKAPLRLPVVLCGMGLLSFGSSISSFSTSNAITTQVSYVNFDATGNSMGPMVVTDNNGGVSGTCTWASGSCVAADFTLSYPGGSLTYPGLVNTNTTFWTLINTSGADITSLTINTLAGSVALDRCLAGNTFDTDPICFSVGTNGSNLGWTIQGRAGDGNTVSATAQYSNELFTGANAPVGDAYGFASLTFSNFHNGNSFTFLMDTDLVQAAVPEPATLGLVGGALLALGVLRRKRRKLEN